MEMGRPGFYGIIFALLMLLLCWATAPAAFAARTAPAEVPIYFFWGEGCPHCERAKPFLAELGRKYPLLKINSYEIYSEPKNIELLKEMAMARGGEATGVPTIFIGGRMIEGFSDEKGKLIEAEVQTQVAAQQLGPRSAAPPMTGDNLSLPLLGRVNPASMSLLVFTLVIAALDSFNPCAFFVLLFLLSLLVHAHSRSRMALIGGTFVFFSGIIYFVFMAAWLNFFLLAGAFSVITTCAGIIAIGVAAINIKDFFYFKRWISLTIAEEDKPKLFERMRNLVRAGSLLSTLAVAANSYELLCTAGFPMVFTRVLTLSNLATSGYYLYLLLYNLVYLLPLAIIVGIFTATLGSRKLTEWQGRKLKLLSGVMMLLLGLVILFKPSLLNNAVASMLLLGFALGATACVAWLARKVDPAMANRQP